MRLTFEQKYDRDFELRRRALGLSREKGRLEYFEAQPLKPLAYLPEDSERIRYIKQKSNGDPGDGSFRPEVGSLYMERSVTAAELAERLTEQGWTTLVIRRTHWGHQGPKWNRAVIKLMETLSIGEWVMEPVERCWSVVVATKNPADIEPFKALLLPRDR